MRLGEPGESIALIQLVPFSLDEIWYALDVRVVERVLPLVRVARLPDAPPIALGAINVHGDVVPVVDIRQRLGFPSHDQPLSARLLVARTSRRRLAFPVDEVGSVREIDAGAVIPPETLLPGLRHLEGIVALPEGLLFIEDLDAFLGLDEEARLTAALERVGA